ncbi:MAG: sulfite exporter TauE/SafE family protein [Deltaproteobacteria bacterium]|jgi:uncharacterized membrane protein YfcA
MTMLAHPIDIIGLIGLGFGVGAYGTLIGAGGGFVLMPILLLLYPHDSPELLTSISLAVVFFNTVSGSEAYAMMKRIDYKSGLLFGAAATPGAVFGALNTRHVPRHLFDTIFGAVLLAAAAFLAFRSEPKERPCQTSNTPKYWTSRDLTDAHDTNYCFSFNPYLGIGISLFVGYISSFFGIGGGIIHVPALTYLLHFPIHIATATSHFILAQMALAGTVAHILTGAFSQGVSKTVSLAIGVLIGAQVGAHLSNRFKGVWLIRSLSIALGLVAIRILYKAL